TRSAAEPAAQRLHVAVREPDRHGRPPQRRAMVAERRRYAPTRPEYPSHLRPALPERAAEVAERLLAYLQSRLGVPGLGYAAPPAAVAGGLETYLYTFRLRGPGLPAAWDRPLVLRIHADRRGQARARHEYEVHQFLARHGYPAPAPLLYE